MTEYYPGTVVKRNGRTAKEFIDGVFFTDVGLTMAQVKEITGLDSFIIQNWVSRGWVGRPEGKRYGKDRFSRILLINMLRSAAKLEDIAKVLGYINGVVNDPSDDIIEEAELYVMLCNLFDRIDITHSTGPGKSIEELVFDFTSDYQGNGEFRKKLEKGILTLALWYMAAQQKEKAEALLLAMSETSTL